MTIKPIAAAIEGAKGGGDQRTPVESADSLRSIAYFRILDLVSEGEIGGLVNGAQSIFLDETPLANADGSLNFQNTHVETRTGTQDQDPIPGYPAVENEISIGVELKSASPWVRSITNTELSAARVTIGFPALSKANTSNGDIGGYSISYTIDVQTDGGAWVNAYNGTVTGKTTTKYQRSHRIDLPAATTGWSLRVTRTTVNANSSSIADTTTIDSYTEIVDAKLAYPNSALVAVSGDAAHFSNIPSRAYDLWGRIISVPSNYDPLARTYAGVWDGSFKPAWSNNPAWVFYDLVTHPRYGLGNLVAAAQMDKWALYSIAQYCDGLVPDGKGGQEPRFTCNVYLQTADDAYKLLSDLASAFRGLSYWANGAISATADMPSDPAYLYTAANVIDGRFTYASSPRKTRYTTALVTWNDPANFYRAKVEYVQDTAGVLRYGIQPTQVTAFGCTSHGQAQRAGQWLLLTSRLEYESVTFSVGLDGVLAAPGQIIRVQDQARAGKRQGGRIHSATATAITVDKAPDAVAVGDNLTCTLPSGQTETHAITGIAGAVLSVAAPGFSVAPNAESGWVTESTTLAAQTFRVVAVTEDNKQGEISFTLSAVKHDASKFAAIDGSAILQPPPAISNLPATIQAPVASVTVAENHVILQGTAQTVATISWPPIAGADTYQVEWRRDAGDWINAGSTSGLSIDVPGVYSGSYVARVRAVSASGVVSLPTLSAATAIVGKTAPNAPPTLTATGGQLQIVLNWAWPAGVNVEDTNYTEVWVSPTSTMTDGSSVGAVAYPGTSYTISGLLPQQTRYAWVRLVDKSGNVGAWSVPANAVSGTNTDLFNPLQTQIDTLNSDASSLQTQVNTANAQLQVVQGQVSDILAAPAWSSTVTFVKGELVTEAGKLYRSLIDNNLNNDPATVTTAWAYIGNYASLGEAVGANASNISTLQSTVTTQGNSITANTTSINSNTAAIGTKASVTDLNTTNANVTANGNAITAQGADISLLGAHNSGKTAFILSQSTVQVDNAGTTLGSYISSVSATTSGLQTSINTEQSARISGDTANSNAITAVSSRVGAIENTAQNLMVNPTGGAGFSFPASYGFVWIGGSQQQMTTRTELFGNAGPMFACANPGTGSIDQGFGITIPQAASSVPITLSADMDARVIASGQMTVQLRFMNSSGTEINTVNRPIIVASNGQPMKRYSTTATTESGTASIRMLVRFSGALSSSSVIGWRNIKLEVGSVATPYSDNATPIANASAITTLNTTVTNNGTQISANASAINAVQVRMPSGSGLVATAASVTAVQNQINASYTLQLNVNGYVSGIVAQNNGAVSNLVIVADNFSILPSSGTGLRTEYSAGNWRVYDAAGTLRVQMGVW